MMFEQSCGHEAAVSCARQVPSLTQALVGGEDGMFVGNLVGFAVDGIGVGLIVGDKLGLFVGGCVGCLEGLAVDGTGVGLLVGKRVGTAVDGTGVGLVVGEIVGALVGC